MEQRIEFKIRTSPEDKGKGLTHMVKESVIVGSPGPLLLCRLQKARLITYSSLSSGISAH